MKKKLALLCFLLTSGKFLVAQVDIDKPLNLSGGTGERKITNLELPLNGTDAVNKDYVDAQISSVSSGSSNLQFNFTASHTHINIAYGVIPETVTAILTYLSGSPAPVGIQVTGLPSGVTHNLAAYGFPSFSTSFSITADATAASGDYPIVLTAIGGASPQVLNLTLHVFKRVRVFVTSPVFGTGNFGGLSGADSQCNGQAWTLGGNWKAWLSTSSVHAKDRIDDGLYVLTDNTTVVAAGKTDLLDGSLQHAINRTPDGSATAAGNDAWTGTASDGTAVSGNNCSNWTSSSGTAMLGSFTYTDSNWTARLNWNCTVNGVHLYCFEDI